MLVPWWVSGANRRPHNNHNCMGNNALRFFFRCVPNHTYARLLPIYNPLSRIERDYDACIFNTGKEMGKWISCISARRWNIMTTIIPRCSHERNDRTAHLPIHWVVTITIIIVTPMIYLVIVVGTIVVKTIIVVIVAIMTTVGAIMLSDVFSVVIVVTLASIIIIDPFTILNEKRG